MSIKNNIFFMYMVLYQYERCGHKYYNKAFFRKHLKRKFPCKPIVLDINPSMLMSKYFSDEVEKISPESKPVQKPDFSEQKKRTIFCRHCNKEFKHFSSRRKHEKSRCKLSKIIKKAKKEGIIIQNFYGTIVTAK